MTGSPNARMTLRVLAVDDEPPALDELVYLLDREPAVAEVYAAGDATGALRELGEHDVDAVFLDINMPGLSGIELAGVLRNYSTPPAVVFVTAHDDRAVDAFDVGAVDYLLKPVRAERLSQAIGRLLPAAPPARDDAATAAAGTGTGTDEVIPVELGGVTSLVRRAEVGWVEAVGDYARLHTAGGAHLVRIPLSTLESHWRDAGFVRVHRSYLVALGMVTGMRTSGNGTLVRIRQNGQSPPTELPVSRRQLRELKDRLVRDPIRMYRSTDDGDGGRA